MKPIQIAAALFAAGVGIAACGGATAAPKTVHHTLTVSISNGGVIGTPDYQAAIAALSGGVPVTVANQAGVVIGSNSDVFSTVTFRVPDESFYKVTVGNLGTITFSHAELVGDGWQAGVSVG